MQSDFYKTEVEDYQDRIPVDFSKIGMSLSLVNPNIKREYLPTADELKIEKINIVKKPAPKVKKELVFIPEYLDESDLPEQPTPVTVYNFFVRTFGVFDEIDSIPENFKQFFRSKKSTYFTNQEQTHLIRSSDHWGHSIRFCNWYLKTNPNRSYDPNMSSWAWSKRYGKDISIGIIHFSNMTVNRTVLKRRAPKKVKTL